MPQNIGKVELYLIIREAENANAARFKKFSPGHIIRRPSRTGMNTSVHFNFELVLDAERVKNEAVEWMLPAKFQTGETAVTESLPQFLFGGRRLTPLYAGGLDNSGDGLAACFSWHKL